MKKITKEDRRLIANIAKSLPKMVNPELKVRRMVYGQTLINANTKQAQNNEINSRSKYITGEIAADVNHRKELEKMFIKFGEVGLAIYQKQILEKAVSA